MLKRLFVIFLLVLAIGAHSLHVAFAETDQERLQDLQQQISDLQGKINQARSNINTLNGQLESMDNQIKLTTLKITDAQKKIALLENDIDLISRKIVRVEDSLSLLQQTLLQRLRASYAYGEVSPLELYMSSGGFSEALTDVRYLQFLQKHDMKLLADMRGIKQNYGDQKVSLETRQQQLQEAKAELDKQNTLLAQQKADKQRLLEATKNDEKRFQQLLTQSKAEVQAIESAIAGSYNLKNGVHVSKGEVIALVGNSGSPSCSTGAHLHFEVRQNGVLKNPADYLSSRNLTYDDEHTGRINGSGSWDWPISNPIITQEFGMTYWARLGFYGGGPHTGIDMVSRDSISIHAVADGMLYRASTRCGSSTLKYAVLDHGGGIRTYYLHIQ